MPVELFISEAQFDQIATHLAACLPNEGCGIIGGDTRFHAILILPVENRLKSPTRYSMDEKGQLDAMVAIEKQGLEIIAIFHSHPNGPEIPSPTDLAEYYYPDSLMLIFSHSKGTWTARAFQVDMSRNFQEVLVSVI